MGREEEVNKGMIQKIIYHQIRTYICTLMYETKKRNMRMRKSRVMKVTNQWNMKRISGTSNQTNKW